jgi:hypothetical protein
MLLSADMCLFNDGFEWLLMLSPPILSVFLPLWPPHVVTLIEKFPKLSSSNSVRSLSVDAI